MTKKLEDNFLLAQYEEKSYLMSCKLENQYHYAKHRLRTNEKCYIQQEKNENQKIVVVSDFLSFVSNKINDMTKSCLLKCIRKFYSKSDALSAYKLLSDNLHISKNLCHKNLKIKDPYLDILKVFKYSKKIDQILFVCKNLDNIPKIRSVKNELVERRIHFIEEHKAIKNQINDLYRCLYQIREQFIIICSNSLILSEIPPNKNGCLFFSPHKPQRPVYLNNKIKKDISYLQQFVDEDSEIEDETILNVTLREENCDKTTFNSSFSNEFDGFIECDIKSESADLNKNNNANTQADSQMSINLYKEKLQDFLIIEQMFDKNIGQFTIFKCPNCSFTSNEEKTVMNHKCIQDEMKVVKQNRQYTCITCLKSFKSMNRLRFHRKSEHPFEKRIYQCPLCTASFSKGSWKEHVRLCLGNGKNILTQDDIHCKVCDIFYSDQKLLKNHKAFHDQSRPFECHECKFRFYSQKTVEDHFKIHAIERIEGTFKCPFCPRSFALIGKREEHIRTHTGERPHKCSLCNFAAIRPSGLKSHIKTHTESKDFSCNICGRGFKLKTKLTVHKKVHSSYRPFKCPECGKGFKSGREMTTHHRNHLGIRNHPCPYCNYKAVNAAVLRGHINVHFNKKPFKCSQCSFGCNHKSYLNWHIKNSHPNIVIAKM